MKFLAVFLLTLSLVATSSFAVSLNPPLVLSMQEYEGTMTSDDFDYNERSEADLSVFKPAVGVISYFVVVFGFVVFKQSLSTDVGYEQLAHFALVVGESQ